MKLQPDAIQGPSITAYGPGWVAVNGEKHSTSIVISTATGCQPWSCTSFDALNAEHFDQFALMDAEMILFGSGDRIRFPHPKWLQALYAKRIGVETMDTQAACRTYNFLAGEGRKVVAALLL
jgi:uncharacterized protein